MVIYRIITTALILLFFGNSQASNRYWIYFKDKGSAERQSQGFKRNLVQSGISGRASERRVTRGIYNSEAELLDKDLPVNIDYLAQLEKLGVEIHGVSKWLNAASGTLPNGDLNSIRRLNFVDAVEPVKVWKFSKELISDDSDLSFFKKSLDDSTLVDYGDSGLQILFHNIQKLHEKGLNGKDVIVAVFDTGFRLNHPSVLHIKEKLIAERDFINGDNLTANEKEDHITQDYHGTAVLSALGGNAVGTLVGPAFGASFILAKTELITDEINLEEDNWMMAAEWAEALGADIVSSSLGYSVFDSGEKSYSYEDMDGRTTVVTRAANELAKRGVLVVNSAGNEGNRSWKYIIAPADGFYVLAAGALTSSNQVASFSSFGPTADGRIKPDVSALGVGVYSAVAGGDYSRVNGTSLSAPLISGIAAQILQAYPGLNLLQLLDLLRNSGDAAQNPNNSRGWGKIDALKAWTLAADLPTETPDSMTVLAPRPNPSYRGGGFVTIPVTLPEQSSIKFEVYNILGQLIYQQDFLGAASQNLISWDQSNLQGRLVSAGIYIFKLSSVRSTHFGKIIIVK